jgi:hypothetical protein
MRRIFWVFAEIVSSYRSLTLPFRFWLWIRGDIHKQKTTLRLAESEGFWMFIRKLSESASRRLSNSASQRLSNSASRYGESGSRYSNFLKFILKLQQFKWLNQPLKRSIWRKRSQRCNVLSPLIYLMVWTPRVEELFFDYEYLCEFEAEIGMARNVV